MCVRKWGTYHCFGCGESGDVYSFVMAMEHTGFTETVERLAARIGYTLHYERRKPRETGTKQACAADFSTHTKIAAEFLLNAASTQRTPGEAQRFLGARGFDPAATKTFGVGYAPPRLGTICSNICVPKDLPTRNCALPVCFLRETAVSTTVFVGASSGLSAP